MTNDEIFAGTVLKNWKSTMSQIEKTIKSLSDEQYESEVAPGRNRVRYVVGHMAAFQDRLVELLGLGSRAYPELDVFLRNPDRSFDDEIAGARLGEIFLEQTDKITAGIEAMPAADLLKRHNDVSEEDFAKEPLRNRLAVLQGRLIHAMYHAGQIRLAVKR